MILMMGLCSACAAQSTQTATSAAQPTQQILLATATTQPPLSTDTAAPTEAAQSTEAPATQPAGQGATVSFANDIFPIIESRCVNCHGGQRTEHGLDMTTFENLMSGSENGPVVTPGDAVHSKFVELVVNQKMPKRGPKLTPPQVQLFTDWVAQGASNN